MRRVALVLSGLILLGVSAEGASAQTPGKAEILNALSAPAPALAGPRTRSLGGGPATRKIDIVGVPPEKVLEEIKGLPSINIRVLFALDSDKLTPEGEAALKPLGEVLATSQLASAKFLLGGHTDAAGSEAHNLDLSKRRAETVRTYLVKTFGIEAARLDSTGFGFKNLADPKNPRDGVNRRVEVVKIGQ